MGLASHGPDPLPDEHPDEYNRRKRDWAVSMARQPVGQTNWQAVALGLNLFFAKPGKTSYGQKELLEQFAVLVAQHTTENPADDGGPGAAVTTDRAGDPLVDSPQLADGEGAPHGNRNTHTDSPRRTAPAAAAA